MLEVKREKLLNALEYVQPGLSNRDVIDQAGCFVFKNGYIYTYNDEVACRCKSPIPELEAAVKAGPLLTIMHRLKQDRLKVRHTDKKISFEGKREWVDITVERDVTFPIEDLDYPTKKSKWKILPSKFSEAVEFVQSCASRDDGIRKLTCIHLHPKMMEAFDNYQYAKYKIRLKLKEELLVKQIALKHIAKMTMIEFCATDNWIHFRDARKQIFSCRVYLEEYPNCNSIPKIDGVTLKLPSGLAEGATRAEVFQQDGQQPEDNYIEVTLSHNLAIIIGQGQFGKYTKECPLKYKGEKFTFMIHPNILEELVKDHSECILSTTSMLAKTGDGVFVTSLTPPKKKKLDKEIEKSEKKKGKKK